MDMKHNTEDRPGVSTRAWSALAPPDKQGAFTIPNKKPAKTPKLPRMASAQPARIHSDGPRPSPGMFNQEKDVRRGKGEEPGPVAPRRNPRHQRSQQWLSIPFLKLWFNRGTFWSLLLLITN
ncbi:hypothetical protein LIER_07439 [Lithospermum erythrorhizon]|uniref:Uncharacterized protein n=1 Tax=Lithospermum erythrorhizon TaxID=34254 RepID=A0AAV3P9D5_LITER